MSSIGRNVVRVMNSVLGFRGARQRIQGYIDTCTPDLVSGWIRYARQAGSITIDVVINGIVVAEGVRAESARRDVRDAGFGDGHCGFVCDLTMADLTTRGGERLVEIRIAGRPTVVMSRFFSPEPEAASVVPAPANHAPAIYEATIDAVEKGAVRGWAVDRADPTHVFPVDVLIDGIPFTKTVNDRPRRDLADLNLSTGLGGINVELPLGLLPGGRHEVALRLPDGRRVADTIDIPRRREDLPYLQESGEFPPLAIIVPVYNAADDLEICIERLSRFTPADVEILLIDDSSPDPRIGGILDEAARRPGFRILRNNKNLGFSGTVNRGITETAGKDVIFLNSDARVTPGWIDGLRRAAYHAPKIATATPLSDRAGAFSAPEAGNENTVPQGVDEISFARAVRRESFALYPLVPTGNGFCMYVRRACLDAVGLLDAEAFPRGYGEENDFCMRAGRMGWRHVIDDRTYVFHDRSKSFGAAKTDLMAAGRQIVDTRYPEYKSAISVFSRGPKIMMARYAVRRLSDPGVVRAITRTRVLFVISTQTGGTPQTNRDLMGALDGEFDGWSLRCTSSALILCRFENGQDIVVREHVLSEPVDPITHQSAEYDAVVASWLFAYDFDLVHIRHIGWHGLTLPRIAKRFGMPVVFSFHDFYMLSPTIKLIDDDGVYLGDNFRADAREGRQSLWPAGSQPDPTGEWLNWWRERNAAVLEDCDAFVTTSESAKRMISAHFPNIPPERFAVIPHGRDFSKFHRLQELYQHHGTPVRILIPGNIDSSKGLDILMALAQHDTAGMLEFHVLGNAQRKDRQFTRHFRFHGAYSRDNFAARVEPLRPHIAAVFSIWDETWCHTLTECWSVGLPVAVFDMPTVAGRVRESGAGWVLDHTDIPALYDALIRIATDPDERAEKEQAIARWQNGYGIANTTRTMAADYLAIYRDLLKKREISLGSAARAKIAVICPSSRDLTLSFASTSVRVWERTRNAIDRDLTFIRMTPETFLAALNERSISAAIIQRTALPQTIAPRVLDAMVKSEVPFIFDIDDNLLAVSAEKDPRGIYRNYAPTLRRLLAEAAIVTVSTEMLAEELRAEARNVSVLQNRLSDRLWRFEPQPRISDGMLRALYMGTPTHDSDLAMVLPALERIAEKYPGFELALIGITGDSGIFAGRERWLKRIEVPQENKSYEAFIPWLREQGENFDFALAPLSDEPFNLCKSPLKLLDCAALGLPVVASDHPVYRGLQSAAPGLRFAKNTPEDWFAAIEAALETGVRTPEITAAQRAWVLSSFMIEDEERNIDSIIETVGGAGRVS